MPSESNSWQKDVSRAWIEHLPARYRALDSGLRKLRPVAGDDVPEDSITCVVHLRIWPCAPDMEALIGAAVAIGFRTRVALFAGTVLMLALMFGTTLRKDWATVGIQFNYSLIYCLFARRNTV
jgi:uncharacterized membrane protein YphA (DoxX/SURF4 family)